MSGGDLNIDAATERLELNSAVMKVDNELHEDDFETIKFLCQGLVVGKKLNRIDSFPDLVVLLETAGHLSNIDYFLISDLLQYISRVDILELILSDEVEVFRKREQVGSKVDPFYVLLCSLSEELTDDDVKRLAYCYGKIPRSQKLSSGLDIFRVMIQHQAIGPRNVTILSNIFKQMEREDLVEKISKYNDTEGRSVLENIKQTFLRSLAMQGKDISNFHMPTSSADNRRMVTILRNPVVEPIKQHHTDIDFDFQNQARSPGIQTFKQTAELLPFVPNIKDTVVRDRAEEDRAAANQRLREALEKEVIPVEMMEDLTRNIPDEYWYELSYHLKVPVPSTSGSKATIRKEEKLLVFKRWHDQSSSAKGKRSARVFFLQALHDAGLELLAESVAQKLKIHPDEYTLKCPVQCNEVSSERSALVTIELESQTSISRVADSQDLISQTQQLSLSINPSPIKEYTMDHTPRGLCLIINNRNFYADATKVGSRQMPERIGTDIDRDKLTQTFRRLDFHVVTHENLTDTGLLHVLMEVAKCDHESFDCFVCCILTHGNLGSLYGVNGLTVPIKELTSFVRARSCPSLAGKPKLFFLQACQGRDKQGGHPDVQADCIMEEDGPPELIPDEADFLLGYATVPGYVSYRSKSQGSWYITMLTQILDQYAYEHDILDILTLVNYEVGLKDANLENEVYKQSPAPMYSLRKKLIFRRPRL